MEDNYKLAQWLNGELNQEELKEFEASPDYPLYEKLRNYSADLQVSDFNQDALLHTIVHSKKENTKIIPLYKTLYFRIAAILVLGLGIWFFMPAFSGESITAANGQQTTFELPDQSQVTLNSGSEAFFKKWNWDNNREIQLKGEAYFRVAKGKRFTVETQLGSVTVLGTQFNVKARNDRFYVTCYEGKVRVLQNGNEVILTPGESVAFEKNTKLFEHSTTDKLPSWKNKQLSFDSENLQDVVAEIERQYQIAITLENVNSNQVFTGKIPADNLDVALQIIASTYHLQYLHEKDKVTLRL